MKKNTFLLIIIFLLYIILPLQGQTYLGINYQSLNTLSHLKFGGEDAFQPNIAYDRSISLAYYFKRKEKNYNSCYALELNPSFINRRGSLDTKEIYLSSMRIPLMVSINIPRNSENKNKPLFDAFIGVGYYIDIPIISNYDDNELYTSFNNHGIMTNIGLALYTNRAARFEISLCTSTDIGIKAKNIPGNYDALLQFKTFGIKAGFSTPLYLVKESILSRKKP